jgi:hypothetical protein
MSSLDHTCVSGMGFTPRNTKIKSPGSNRGGKELILEGQAQDIPQPPPQLAIINSSTELRAVSPRKVQTRAYFRNWHWENKLRKLIGHTKGKRIRSDLTSVRGHKGERPARPWLIVCELAQGNTDADIGKKLSRDFSTIADDARNFGFSGRRCQYDFGDRFLAGSIQQLKKATGLSASQLSTEVGVSSKILADQLRRRSETLRTDPEVARKFILWRDNLVRRLLANISKPALDLEKHSGSSLLKTLFPKLHEKRRLLRQILTWCRHFLREKPDAGIIELQDYLCRLAAIEPSQRNLFVRFLPWTPELMPFLEANLKRVRGPGTLWQLTDEAIAKRLGTTPAIVGSVSRSRVRTIPAQEMRRLIRAFAFPSPQNRRTTGKRGIASETEDLIRLAAACRVLEWSKRRASSLLYPESVDPYTRAKQLYRRHSSRIENLAHDLTRETAQSLISRSQTTASAPG